MDAGTHEVGGWRIEMLGGLRAVQGDRVVTHFRTQKTGLLLAYLAFHTTPGSQSPRTFPREQLMELLWPEVDRRAGLNHLKATLRWLRQELEPPGVPFGAVLRADRTCVALDPAVVTTDVAEFAAALEAAARAATSAERAELIAQAVELYRGELLPGCHEEWVLQERQWLVERFFQALGQQIAHLERAGDLSRALELAQRGVSLDPLREEAHAELMRLYAAAGQPAAARRQYAELERLLKEALDETPSAATRALIAQIERQSLLRRPPAGRSTPPGLSPTGQRAEARSRPGPGAPALGENRLVTVLFADMSRSVETMRDLHPEDAVALINRLFGVMVDAVLQNEGHVDRFLGDGLLAVFGLLQAHEDDAERAIQAALAIREGARKLGLEVTAGINTGSVYVGEVGSEQHQERTVVGPVVNLAARLQEQAQPGQLLVGEATWYQSRGAFQFDACSLHLQGFPQPVPAFAVLGALSRPQKARGLDGLRAELIGRDRELAQLQEALAALQHGQGQMVSLIGEAGVGKSRLVAELQQGVEGQGVGSRVSGVGSDGSDPTPDTLLPTPLWFEGRCLELNLTTGYSLFLDLLREYFAWGAGQEERERVERLQAALQAFVGWGELSAQRAEEMAPLLGNLFALRSGTDWDLRFKNASPEQIRHQTLLAVRDFLVALAGRQPLVLVCEDLHWADRLSLDLLALLMEAVPRAPIMLLCVYRPERDHPCWRLGSLAAQKCAEQYTELPLRELTPPQSRRLVESLLRLEQLPAGVRETILAKSRGNPFFLEEIVRSLIEAGILYRDGEIWRGREPETRESRSEQIQVPESLRALILSRVDRLRPEVRQLLQTASVIGRLFRRRLLEQMADEEPDLPRLLWDLEERGLIYQERVVPEEEYSFKHVLTQETIYYSLLRRQQAALHHQVGEAIERLYRDELEEQYEQLAYHYERSEADEKAAEYLLKAGEKSRRGYANEAAINYLQRALDRAVAPSGREERGKWQWAAHRELGLTYQGVGKVVEAEAHFRQAISLGRHLQLPAREVARLYHWLADTLWWQDRFQELLQVGREGQALLGADTESVEAAMLRFTVMLGASRTGDFWKEMRAYAHEAAPLLERLPLVD